MASGRHTHRLPERRERPALLDRRGTVGRHTMAVAASVLVAVATAAGVLAATDRPDRRTTAEPRTSATPLAPAPIPAAPLVSRTTGTTPSPASPPVAAKPPQPTKLKPSVPGRSGAVRGVPLYRHPDSQVLDWVRAHQGDPRRSVIESRIASRPAAVWFAAYNPGAVTGQVRAVTAGAVAAGRVPVLVPYAIPDRDCGGASQGGAPDLAAYDGWMNDFASGLGDGPVIVILEPDSVALAECLGAGQRAARYTSLARAARSIHAANSLAKVYFDAGHSGWHSAAKQAELLRAAGAAGSGDGIFTNVSNFHRTEDETRYARDVLAALGGSAGLGAVIDTSRNGRGAPPAGQWCDPDGRTIGRAPTTETGVSRIDAYLWVKPPGESDGCKGDAGTFTPDYAYELAQG